MKKRINRIFSLAISVLLLLSLCACDTKPENKAKDASGSGEMTIGALTLFTASNLDPAAEWNGWFDSLFGIGETLFKLDDSMAPQPWLVDTYEYDQQGGVTWTLNLKDNITYTNGEKLTAETVKASLERTIEVCERANDQLYIDHMDADGQKLTIVTSKPSPTLINELCDPMCVIEYVGDGIDYEKAPVLTGPFITSKFVQNDICVVTKNENYWGGKPNLDQVTFKTYSDGDALTMALQAGEIDAAYDLPSASLKLFENDNYSHLITKGSRGNAIFFNCESKNVADVNLRTAIAMSIDREAFVSTMNGTAAASYGMFPESMSCGGADKLKLKVTKDSNVDTAKQLLEKSGYTDSNSDGILEKDGTDVSLIFAIGSDSTASMFAQSLQSQLKKLGIKLEIKTYETTNSAYSDSNFDIGISPLMMAPTGNPQYFFNMMIVTRRQQK